MNNKIDGMDMYLAKNQVIFEENNFTELLITELYLKEGFDKVRKLKRFLYGFILLNFNRLQVKQDFDTKMSELELKQKKYIFIQMFHADDYRHFSILDGVIKELLKTVSKQEILIFTPHQDVIEYFQCLEIDIIQLKVALRSNENILVKKIKFKEFTVYEKTKIIQGISMYKTVKNLFAKMSIKILFTTQDFHYYDQIFTKAAKSLGIKTITHQHGLVDEQHPGLFKYVFSDYIMVWGRSTYESLNRYIPGNKIHIVGTEKFSYLSKKPKKNQNEFITIGLNPISDKENIVILNNLLCILNSDDYILKNIKKVVIKLHPSMKYKKWSKIVNGIIEDDNNYFEYEVTKENNFEILHKTKILIVQKSTLALEGMIVGCSVVELKNHEVSNNSGGLYFKLQESLVTYESIGFEIQKRLRNKNYNNTIIEKQNDAVKNMIERNIGNKEVEIIKFILSE